MKKWLIAGGAFSLAIVGTFAWRVVSASGLPMTATEPRERPDILLVTIDALRADHVSAYGYSRITTPTIDAFARDAVRIDDAIAQAPYTKASIASVMTGLYPSSHKTYTTSVPFPETMTGHPTTQPIQTDVLPSSARTLAESLRAAGYQTIGFTTNPFLIEAFGFGRGFDRFRFYPGEDFATADHVVADALEAARTADRNHPVFAWVHLMEPHSPYVPPRWAEGAFKVQGAPEPIPASISIPAWLLPGSPRDRRLYVTAYDEEIAASDVAFGALIRGWRDSRPWRPCVVVLTADHGEQFLEHHGWEHSTNLHDELIRVPLVIQVPGVAPRVAHVQVELLDLFPTLMDLGGANGPPTAGRSLIGVLNGTDGSRPALSEIVGSQYSIRSSGWKEIGFADGHSELFDLDRDPGETQDVWARESDQARRMKISLDHAMVRAAMWGRQIQRETASIDPRVLERLRALGYVQ